MKTPEPASFNKTNPTPTERPRVFDYTDYRAYLSDYYEWEKQVGSFSHQVFAQRAGLKSRSYLRLVLAHKRNLTPDSITKFIKGLGLGEKEAEAFTLLVHYNQSQTFEARKHYWEAFLKIQNRNGSGLKVRDAYSFLTHMYYPILLSVLAQKDVDHSPAALSAVMGLTESKIREALNDLEKIGYIQKTERGYALLAPSFHTGDDLSNNIAMATYHKNILTQAQEKLSLPSSEREFRSTSMALSTEEFQYLKQKMRDFTKELDERFGASRPHTQKIYALNLNLIPVTQDFIRPTETSQKPNAVAEKHTPFNEARAEDFI